MADTRHSHSQKKLREMVAEMDREQTYCFYLMAKATLDGRNSLAVALADYYHKIGRSGGAADIEPDWSILKKIKACVPDHHQRHAWAALFIFPLQRGDAECLAAAEAAARLRFSH